MLILTLFIFMLHRFTSFIPKTARFTLYRLALFILMLHRLKLKPMH